MRAYDLSAISVLVVDDTVHMANLTAGMLRAAGVRDIRIAADGAEAWERLLREAVDLVVVDWQMPRLNGLEFLKRVRTDPTGPDPKMPVVMMTGHTELWRIRAMRDAGTTEILAKPLAARTLIDRVLHVLTKPRTFVETDLYFGPDRRRRFDPAPAIGDRRIGRATTPPPTVDEDDTVSLSQAEIDALLNP